MELDYGGNKECWMRISDIDTTKRPVLVNGPATTPTVQTAGCYSAAIFSRTPQGTVRCTWKSSRVCEGKYGWLLSISIHA